MTRVLANASAADRSSTDFFPTPPAVTHALVSWLSNHGHEPSVVWEPACGEGHMSEALKVHGIEVVSSDKYPAGYTTEARDFLTERADFDFDWLITNPPFKESEAFIRQAATYNRPFAFVLKSQYWHSKRRLALFREIPPSAILPLTWRPDFHFGTKGGSPTMEVLWSVWGTGAGTVYEPLPRPIEF